MLIERDKEIKILQNCLDLVNKENGQVTCLKGDIGVGKTELIQYFTDHYCQQSEVVYSRCLDTIFSNELTSVIKHASERSDKINKLFKQDTRIDLLFPELLKFFSNRQKSTVIVIEDVQWANGAMLSFINFFARRILFSPCLLVLSYRDTEIKEDDPLNKVINSIPKNSIETITLNNLSVKSIQKLGGKSDNINQIFHLTKGNPLFISLLNLEKPLTAQVTSIEDAIADQLQHLNTEQHNLLKKISLIPYPIPNKLLSKITADQSLGNFLSVYDSEHHFFRHELIRKNLVSQNSELAQVTAHNEFLALYKELQIPLTPEWELMHLDGAMNAEQSIKLASNIASRSSQLGAHSEAAAYLSIALKYLHTIDNQQAAELQESWAREASFDLNISNQVFSARQNAITLWRSLNREDKVGENLYSLSRLHWLKGSPVQANSLADQAIDILVNSGSNQLAAKAYSFRSQLDLLQCRYTESISAGNTALKYEQSHPDAELRAHALNNVGSSMMLSNDINGENYLKSSLELSLKHNLHEHIGRAYANYACCAQLNKDLDTAEKIISEGISYGVTHENESKLNYLAGVLAQVKLEQGKLHEAERIAKSLLEKHDHVSLVNMPALNVLARTQSLIGDESARSTLDNALFIAVSLNEPRYIITSRLNLIEYAWLHNCEADAQEQIDCLSELSPDSLGNWNFGELLCWRNRFNANNKSFKSSILPEPYTLELNQKYNDAAKQWKELKMPINAALCMMSDLAQGRADHYSEVLDIISTYEAEALFNKLQTIGEQHHFEGCSSNHRRGKSQASKKHPLELTKKEQQVLNEILQGKSNSDISNYLKRSIRTVESHVSSIINKFNVNNRLEVILRVQNEPWLKPLE